MNYCMYDLFQNDEKRNRFAKGLPKAFDMVRKRMPKGNPAVGLLREHVIIGFFEAAFGQARCTRRWNKTRLRRFIVWRKTFN